MRLHTGNRRIWRWLAVPAVTALLLLFPGGEKGGHRMGPPFRGEPAAFRKASAGSLSIRWRDDGLRVGTAPADGVHAFAEVDAEDHRDGLRDDPKYSLAWHRQQRLIIERQYGFAIASLGLSESDGEKLTGLLTARREATIDGRDAAQRLGIVGPEANLAVKQAVDADTDEIKRMVGEDAYFGCIEPAPVISSCRAFLENSVGTELASQGNPLTAGQLYSLAADYVGAVYSPAASEGPQEPDSTTGLTPQCQAFLDKVSTRLTPDQVSAFHGFLVRQSQPQHIDGAPQG